MVRWPTILFAFLVVACTANPPPAPIVAAPVARMTTDLADGWQFRFDDGLTSETATALPDSEWQLVALPHTWNRLGEYRIGRTAATDNRQGTGWYRLRLDGARLPLGRRHVIEFDAVGNLADLWVNGRHVGRHAGAFSRFRFDLTDVLDPSGPNILLLRADNSKPEPGSATQHIIPLDGDFFIHGGIYRPARLLHVAPSHIALDDHGGPGVYATPTIENGLGKLAVRVKLSGAIGGQTLVAILRDATGRTVSEVTTPLTAQQDEAALTLDVAAPRRWNGRADPFLYRLETRLSDITTTLDSVTVPVGFREFRIDPNTGFYLNGKSLPLHGVSRHQDYLGKGWALATADHERDMALIAEMGANTVRFAHYQHAQDWFDLADRYGMIVWAELPFVNRPSNDGSTGASELVANAKAQMVELIRQNYNHPSVVTWGIGNEVDLDMVTGRAPQSADARPLLRELHALSKAEDPSRPTVIADCCEATHEGLAPPGERPRQPVLTGLADLMGYNRYFGWYYRGIADLGPHLDRLHARYPGIPISVSEYGAGGALSQHVEDGAAHKIAHASRMHPEEFQSWYHEQSWLQLRDRPYLWANWIWNMFDFSSKIRQEGDATDVNDKGLVTYDRKVKKDAFFYYKAQWSAEPVVHINSRRWTSRTEPLTRIKIYSNAPSVTVTLNGAPLGTIACADRICEIRDIRLVPGANRVTARAVFGGKDVTDAVDWILAP